MRALRGQVMSKELAEHGYYKQKGEVEKLVSKYVAQVCMLGSGDLLQARPRTARLHMQLAVLPCVGGRAGLFKLCLRVLLLPCECRLMVLRVRY